MTDVKFLTNFEEESPAVKEHCFNTYVVKKPKSDMMHCERLCPAGAVAPSFTCWLTAWLFSGRDRRNSSWTICVPPLSSNLRKLKNLEILFIPDPILFLPDPKLFFGIDSTKNSFLPDLKYSYRIWNIHTGSSSYPYRVLFCSCGSKFIKLLLTIPESSNIIVSWPLFENYLYRVWKHKGEAK